MIHHEDQGQQFGKWPNATAQLMYHDIMPLALSGIDTTGRVADFGGANGLLREWIPQATTVDYDESKQPDICEDICTHRGDYDLVVMRYVLHYMPDPVARKLLDAMAGWLRGNLLIIQFVNADLAIKQHNSVGEIKYFRNEAQLANLLDPRKWTLVSRKAVAYRVDADFYRWRLGHLDPLPHDETVVIYELQPKG